MAADEPLTTEERTETEALEAYRLTGTGPSECQDCGAGVTVAFVRGTATKTTPKSEYHKLVLEPDPRGGTVVLSFNGMRDERTFCRVLSDEAAAQALEDGLALYSSHSATCPHAEH